MRSSFVKRFVLAGLILALSFSPSFARSLEEYKFKVHNNTKVLIKKILVSEDGESWGPFDIGKGIPAGATVDLVWAASTNDAGCEWYFKAVWSDGGESEPSEFDFCEKGLVINFSR